MADDLVPRRILDRRLALDDHDHRIGGIADPVEHLPHLGRPLLADRGERRQLG